MSALPFPRASPLPALKEVLGGSLSQREREQATEKLGFSKSGIQSWGEGGHQPKPWTQLVTEAPPLKKVVLGS